MEIKKLQSLVIDALEDVKAQDIAMYDTAHLTSLFDRIVIASGTSNRQTKALAASVRDKVKQNGGDIVSIEGEDTGEWVLVDLGDIIIHIMQPAIRAYYRLEEIWGDKPVKFGAAKRVSKRTASEPMDEPAPKKVGRHLAASQATTLEEDPTTAKKPRARKSAAAAEGDGAAEAAPKKTVRKTTPKAPTGAKVKVAVKKSTAASAAAAKAAKPAAKRAPARAAAPKAKAAE